MAEHFYVKLDNKSVKFAAVFEICRKKQSDRQTLQKTQSSSHIKDISEDIFSFSIHQTGRNDVIIQLLFVLQRTNNKITIIINAGHVEINYSNHSQ